MKTTPYGKSGNISLKEVKLIKHFFLSGMLLMMALAVIAPDHSQPKAEPEPQSSSPQPKPFVAITEVWLHPDTPLVALTNLGAEPVEMRGWFLCNRPGYFQLPNRTLNPGQRVVVHLGVSGMNTTTDVFTGSRLPKPSQVADELALYVDGNFSSANSIVDYVQWGRAGQTSSRERVAIDADIWSPREFLDISGVTSVQSIYFDGEGDSASDYFIERSVLAEGNSADVVIVHSLSGLSMSPSTIQLAAGQSVRLMNGAQSGVHDPVQLVDASGNVVFSVSFGVRPGELASVEFIPTAGTYTLTHQAHGHPIQGKVIVK